jgi:hypothetical protein
MHHHCRFCAGFVSVKFPHGGSRSIPNSVCKNIRPRWKFRYAKKILLNIGTPLSRFSMPSKLGNHDLLQAISLL